MHRLYQDLKAQGHGVAKDAVHAMLGHVLDAFLISTVPLATESERRRNSNPRKAYPVDPGLIGAFDTSNRANLGHSLEPVVLNELERRKAEVGYVKTRAGFEVDFRARYLAGGEELVQVCADLSAAETMDRDRAAVEVGRFMGEDRLNAKRPVADWDLAALLKLMWEFWSPGPGPVAPGDSGTYLACPKGRQLR